MSPFLSLHYILYTLFPKSQHLTEKKSHLDVYFSIKSLKREKCAGCTVNEPVAFLVENSYE